MTPSQMQVIREVQDQLVETRAFLDQTEAAFSDLFSDICRMHKKIALCPESIASLSEEEIEILLLALRRVILEQNLTRTVALLNDLPMHELN